MNTNRASTALGALSDPTRRAIFERLFSGPFSVGELASEFPVSRPAVSQHLRVLKKAGLVIAHADGTRRVYEVHLPGVEAIRTYFDQFWSRGLTSFKLATEKRSRKPHG